jgi:hypothetical protein
MSVFVYRPGGVPGGNVFTKWQPLMAALGGVEGRKILEFDDSFTRCEIPAGTWPMKDVMWSGFGPRPGVPRTRVDILSGARFTGLRMIGGQITLVGRVFAAEGGVPPISDFAEPDQVHIGLRDDGAACHIANQGDVPIFDVNGHGIFFFIQNCLFGVPSLGVVSTSPLIRFAGDSTKTLALNLLGLNQTGSRVVETTGAGTVLFGALSSAAQVAFDQTSIAGDNYRFGPQGRIQRLVLPRPPAPPAQASLVFRTPNALLRCDGRTAFTQDLPSISDGFNIGNTAVKLYSGGQEVVVAEVTGGARLSVRPAAGDTIDGHTGAVRIGPNGSKTFASDGLANWITIAEVGFVRGTFVGPHPDFDVVEPT